MIKYINFLYAIEEVERGMRRYVFAIGDGQPRTPIKGLPGSIEFFDHYCELVAAHGLSIERSFAPVSDKDTRAGRGYPSFGAERKRARSLQAEIDSKRAPHNEGLPAIIVPPNNVRRGKEEQSPARTGESPGEPPRRRSRERGPARFKEGDIVKAIKAARKAKVEIAVIEIKPDGSILIIPGTPQTIARPNPFDGPNPLDDL
jgi:hypothetical protein